ncbi:MAG: hypothetical protein DWI57_03140 [Chloroflexi bacterium]|nr:MAG: hypothetical protein DWI57_03140 [Chloroflexota bacterium]
MPRESVGQQTVESVVRASVEDTAEVGKGAHAQPFALHPARETLPRTPAVLAAQHPVETGAGVEDGASPFDTGKEATHRTVGAEYSIDGRLLPPVLPAILADEEIAHTAIHSQNQSGVLGIVDDRGDGGIGGQRRAGGVPRAAGVGAAVELRGSGRIECSRYQRRGIGGRNSQTDDAVIAGRAVLGAQRQGQQMGDHQPEGKENRPEPGVNAGACTILLRLTLRSAHTALLHPLDSSRNSLVRSQ